MCDGDTALVKNWMSSYENSGKFQLDENWLKIARKLITSYSINDDETVAIMTKTYESSGYILDPHTAVGIVSALKYVASSGDDVSKYSGEKLICLATAHPGKFPEIVQDALHVDISAHPQTPLSLKGIMAAPIKSVEMKNDENSVKFLRDLIVKSYWSIIFIPMYVFFKYTIVLLHIYVTCGSYISALQVD